MLDTHREAIQNGETEARWEMCGTPYDGNDRERPAIVFNGVQYKDELPEELKEAGVEVVNQKSDVVDE